MTRRTRHPFPDRLLTAKEAAEQLGVSVRTIERLTAQGKLPVVRPGGSRTLRYSLYSLMDVIRRDERRLA